MPSINNKTGIPIGIITIKATEDVVANRFISIEGKHCTTANKIIGVSMKKCKAGKLIPVCIVGVAVVETEININAGNEIRTGADGKAAIATNNITGIYALDNAAIGGFIRVKL